MKNKTKINKQTNKNKVNNIYSSCGKPLLITIYRILNTHISIKASQKSFKKFYVKNVNSPLISCYFL